MLQLLELLEKALMAPTEEREPQCQDLLHTLRPLPGYRTHEGRPVDRTAEG